MVAAHPGSRRSFASQLLRGLAGGALIAVVLGVTVASYVPNGRRHIDRAGPTLVHFDDDGTQTVWVEGTGSEDDDVRAPAVTVTDIDGRPVPVRVFTSQNFDGADGTIAIATYDFDTRPGDYHVDVEVREPAIGATALTRGQPPSATRAMVGLDAVSIGAGPAERYRRMAFIVVAALVVYSIGFVLYTLMWRARGGARLTPAQAVAMRDELDAAAPPEPPGPRYMA